MNGVLRLASASMGGCLAVVLLFFAAFGLIAGVGDIGGELRTWILSFLSWPVLSYIAWRGGTLRAVWGRAFLFAGIFGSIATLLLALRYPADWAYLAAAVAAEVSVILAFALLRNRELAALADQVRSKPRLAIQVGLLGVGLVLLVPVLSLVVPRLVTTPVLGTDVPTEGKFMKDAGEETYYFDGKTVKLHQGVFRESYGDWLKRPRNPYDKPAERALYLSEDTSPAAASRIVTVQLTGQQVRGDAASDGVPDEAVIFSFNAGTDSTWFYLTLRRTNGSWGGETTNSIPLGDRVRVEQVRIDAGDVFVDVVERKPGDPLTASPSVPLTREFRVRIASLEEVQR
jgi:hypothetical protein